MCNIYDDIILQLVGKEMEFDDRYSFFLKVVRRSEEGGKGIFTIYLQFVNYLNN